jgi:hypothetical protein
MGTVHETILCKGCGTRITINHLESPGDRKGYRRNENFNADVPCERCEEVYSYGPDDIQLVDATH